MFCRSWIEDGGVRLRSGYRTLEAARTSANRERASQVKCRASRYVDVDVVGEILLVQGKWYTSLCAVCTVHDVCWLLVASPPGRSNAAPVACACRGRLGDGDDALLTAGHGGHPTCQSVPPPPM